MNWQNIPKTDLVVKRAVVPKLDGLLEADFAQIEPRLFAYFMSRCGDDSLAAQFRDGIDIYVDMAAGIFDMPYRKVTETERQATKRMFMSLLFGGGMRTLVETQGWTHADAKRLIRNFYDTIPGYRLVHNPRPREPWPGYVYQPGMIQRVIESRGYITTVAGRRIVPEQWGEHKLLAYLIQGSAADIMKGALLRVDECLRLVSGLDSHMILTVHDSILFDVAEHELAALEQYVPNAMTSEPFLNPDIINLEVSLEYSRTNWAEKAPL